MTRIKKFFLIDERNTSIKTELIAGITTFLAMVYILAINPIILGGKDANGVPFMDPGAVFTATAISAAFATLLMGLWAKYPIMLAPGMSMNGFFKGIIMGGALGLSWNLGLLAIFCSGILFLILSLLGIRNKVINAIPNELKYAITAALGFFITFLGLKNAGIIVSNPGTLVALGKFSNPAVLVAFIGVLIALVLIARGHKLAVFIGVVSTVILGSIVQMFDSSLTLVPSISGIIAMPPSLAPTFGKIFDFTGLNSSNIFNFIIVMITFFIIDFFDGASTIVAVGEQAGLTDENGNLPKVGPALFADAAGTIVGACLGTTSVTSYSESGVAAGMGAKTGLAAVVVGTMFLLAMFFQPVFAIFTRETTAPAVIVVGLFMVKSLSKIDFTKLEIAAATFFTIVFTVLTFSPANGMAFGFIFYVVVKLARGEAKQVHPIMYGLCSVFMAYLFLLV